ncbi:MAG: hypothetical protein CL910_07720 [Deltaproteobacteria bacterium]|nr:hypothetical protein [Deltaproteobacteria bacterium]
MSSHRLTDLGTNRPVPALIALAEELRALTEQIVRIPDLPSETEAAVGELGGEIRALTRRLEALAPADRVPRMGAEPVGQRPYYASGVILGDHHPLRPDLTIETEGDVTRGTVRFGVTFEGPPGCVHGGFVAHFFDQVLGEHNLRQRIPAMTGTLSVRYYSAAPLMTELRFEVRHEADGDRKVRTSGFLAAGDEVYCEGEGIFVIPKGTDWKL